MNSDKFSMIHYMDRTNVNCLRTVYNPWLQIWNNSVQQYTKCKRSSCKFHPEMKCVIHGCLLSSFSCSHVRHRPHLAPRQTLANHSAISNNINRFMSSTCKSMEVCYGTINKWNNKNQKKLMHNGSHWMTYWFYFFFSF